MKEIKTKQDIIILVDAFYKKALTDLEIGYFFTEVMKINLEKHLPKLYNFWESILFKKASYSGNPMMKHLEINKTSQIKPAHFDRWLFLWQETVEELYTGELATEAINRANQIGQLMQFKIANNS